MSAGIEPTPVPTASVTPMATGTPSPSTGAVTSLVTGSPTPAGASVPADIVTSPCAGRGSEICEVVYQHTHQTWLADLANVVITRPLPIVTIVLAAVVARFMLHRSIDRVVQTAVAGRRGFALQRLGPRTRRALADIVPVAGERRSQRAKSIGSVLKSVSTVVVYSTAFVMVLEQLGVNLAPLIASASILGVALGFGSQSLVKDILSGMFMLLEDAYGVGDIVQVDETAGVVEAIGLRTTRVRDVHGTLWHVRAGEISRIGNFSQEWARALLDVTVSDQCDTDTAFAVIERTAAALARDPDFADVVLEEPEVWGLEDVSAGALTVRLVVKTQPLKQWDVARELRRRLRYAFAEAGLDFGAPRQIMVVESGALPGPAASPAAAVPAVPLWSPRRPAATADKLRP